MALEYTEEKLNSLDKETVIQLFLHSRSSLSRSITTSSWYWNS